MIYDNSKKEDIKKIDLYSETPYEMPLLSVVEISKLKNEPKWMREFRVNSYLKFEEKIDLNATLSQVLSYRCKKCCKKVGLRCK